MGELFMELKRIIISTIIYVMSIGIVLYVVVKFVELTYAWYWSY